MWVDKCGSPLSVECPVSPGEVPHWRNFSSLLFLSSFQRSVLLFRCSKHLLLLPAFLFWSFPTLPRMPHQTHSPATLQLIRDPIISFLTEYVIIHFCSVCMCVLVWVGRSLCVCIQRPGRHYVLPLELPILVLWNRGSHQTWSEAGGRGAWWLSCSPCSTGITDICGFPFFYVDAKDEALMLVWQHSYPLNHLFRPYCPFSDSHCCCFVFGYPRLNPWEPTSVNSLPPGPGNHTQQQSVIVTRSFLPWEPQK